MPSFRSSILIGRHSSIRALRLIVFRHAFRIFSLIGLPLQRRLLSHSRRGKRSSVSFSRSFRLCTSFTVLIRLLLNSIMLTKVALLSIRSRFFTCCGVFVRLSLISWTCSSLRLQLYTMTGARRRSTRRRSSSMTRLCA